MGHKFVNPEFTIKVICNKVSSIFLPESSSRITRPSREVSREVRNEDDDGDEHGHEKGGGLTIDDTTHFGPAFDTTECGSSPYSTRNQLESIHYQSQTLTGFPLGLRCRTVSREEDIRSGRDLGTGRGDTDDSGYTPSFMTAL